MRTVNTQKQKGQTFLIVALSLVVLLACIGLAIDSAMAYMTKAKLNAAVDSAAVAAARAVTQGATQAEQITNATQAARDFFNANYPAGYLGTTANFPDPKIVFNGGQVTVDTSATAAVPVSFMHVLNFQVLNVAAAAETIRKDLDMAFVIDTTGSMSTGSVPAKVRAGAISFLDKLSQTSDRVALIQFAYGTVVRDQIRPILRGFNKASMDTHINAFSFGGSTNSAEGLWNARDQLNNKIAAANRSSLRVIVFLSDGAPNSFSSFFDFKPVANVCQLAGIPRAGTIATSDGTTANWPVGLLDPYQISAQLGGLCWQNSGIVKTSSPSYISKLPDWYNAHNNPLNPNDPTKQEFPIVSTLLPKYAPRPVTNDVSTQANAWKNVNRASRNLLEAMATKSREEGIYVFTLGLDGTGLSTPSGPDSETGDKVLKCMANTADALPRCQTAGAGQPVGVYCHAVTADDLKPCFDKLASAILRITK